MREARENVVAITRASFLPDTKSVQNHPAPQPPKDKPLAHLYQGAWELEFEYKNGNGK